MSSPSSYNSPGLLNTERTIVHTVIIPVVRRLLNAINASDNYSLIQHELKSNEHIRVYLNGDKIAGVEPVDSNETIHLYHLPTGAAKQLGFKTQPRHSHSDVFEYVHVDDDDEHHRVLFQCHVSNQLVLDFTLRLHGDKHTISYRTHTGFESKDLVSQYNIYRLPKHTHIVLSCGCSSNEHKEIASSINRI